MNLNNAHSQSYWFVLREDQSNVIFSSNNFTLQNPQRQEARYIVDTGDRQFIQINEATAPALTSAAAAAVPTPAEHSDTEPKKEETFWDRSRIKLLLTLCLENNFRNPTKDKPLLDEIAEHVGTAPDECFTKYKNLRRTYIRLLKKKRLGKEIKWVHFDICDRVFDECKSLPPSVLEPWGEGRVRRLLDLYIDNLGRFRSNCLQKDVWRDIASQLETTEYNCYHKFKNLKRAHSKWTQRSHDTGKPSKWPYHRHFERILCEYNPEAGPWNRAKTGLLMAAYTRIAHKFRSPRYHKKDLWREVADVVGESADHCDKKFRNMKQTYIKLKKRADVGRSITKWRYYGDFEAIYDPPDRRRMTINTRDDDYVKRLLNFYAEHKERFRDPRIKNKTVWKSLAPEIGLSPEECDRKFRNLKQTYIRFEEKRHLTGRIGKWPYYGYFERIFDEPKIPRKSIVEKTDIDEETTCDLQRAVRHVHDERDGNFERLLNAMDESNGIQRERNKILERLLLHRK